MQTKKKESSKFSIKEIDKLSKGNWDCLINNCRNATSYHNYSWWSSIKESFKQSIKTFGVTNYKGDIIAGITVLEKKIGNYKIAIRPWSTTYTGVLIRDGIKYKKQQEILKTLIHFLSRYYYSCCMEMPIGFHSLQQFQKNKWKISLKGTFLINGNTNDFIHHIEPSVRRQVKKCIKNNIGYSESSDIVPLYNMYRDLYLRLGNPIGFSEKQFVQFYNYVSESKIAKIFYAYKNGEPIAGMLITRWKHKYFYTLAAYNTKYAKEGAQSYLIYKFIEELNEDEIFDFVGAPTYLDNITRFKSNFNPQEQEYFVIEYRPILIKVFMKIQKIRNRFRYVFRHEGIS